MTKYLGLALFLGCLAGLFVLAWVTYPSLSAEHSVFAGLLGMGLGVGAILFGENR